MATISDSARRDKRGRLVCLASDPQWLSERAGCVTGSELPAIMGRSRYSTRDACLRAKVDGTSIPVTKNMWWGSQMEQPNMEAFSKLSGLPVVPANEFWRWGVLGATIDGYIHATWTKPGPCWTTEYRDFGDSLCAKHKEAVGLIEMKNVSQFALKEWQKGCPEYYELQAQAQLAVTGLDYCVLVAKIGSADMLMHLVEADTLLHQEMIRVAEDFWKEVLDGRSTAS